MTLNESTRRHAVRKLIRFALHSTYCGAEVLEAMIAEDEERAASLNAVKSAIEAEHRALAQRVFKTLANPLPEAAVIREAFRNDPAYKILSSRNAAKVINLIVMRCRHYGWRIPEPIHDLEHWASLYVKWHWHCQDALPLTGAQSIPQKWAGRPKADVEKNCALLHPVKKRKISRNYWYERAPFRMMFGNETCAMSWLKEDFAAARTFLVLDGARIFVGVVPRASRFTPYTLPDAVSGEEAYQLYEESSGASPRLRSVPKLRIDLPAKRGFLLLFELEGRALRSASNLNARYLRALFAPENFADPVLHLERAAEFHVRKGVDIPRNGQGEHFRQRFTERRLFLTLTLTLNAPLAATGAKARPYGELATYLKETPAPRFICVAPASNGGYLLTPAPTSKPQTFNSPSLLVGTLARLAINEDAAILFARNVPRKILAAVADKFAYIVLKDRVPDEPGGVRRGYQLTDRLFVGDLAEAERSLAAHAEAMRLAAESAHAREEAAARKAANRARAEEAQRQAALRRAAVVPDFSQPPFQTGALRFKVEFRLSDNVPRSVECRADTRDEMYQKMRAVSIRPSRVTEL